MPASRRCPTTCTRVCARRSSSTPSTSTSARPGTRRAAASTSSSRPAPRPARRSRSTSPCSTRSHASRSCARSTSIPRKRSRRIRRGRSLRSSSGRRAPRSTTATRPASGAGRSAAGRTSSSNPDMLHVGVLPHHDRWGDVLSNLRYVVIDEAHVYRGVFGSHVANVLRRLRRLARIYGAEPQFLLASATIANPGELVERLLGVPATVIGVDGAPRAERTVVLWNPPLTDEELGLRASPLGEGSRVLGELVSRDLRTLLFAKSRRAAELIHRFALDRLGADYRGRLSPYRAGYT